MMRFLLPLFASALLGHAALAAGVQDWAYPPNPPPVALDNTKPLTVADSPREYTAAQINDPGNAPDWYPKMHPPMPQVVAHGGPKPDAPACALCHLPTGDGSPESANIAGMSETYLIAQMDAFKTGLRQNIRAAPMIAMAKVLSDDEVREAAHYFASLKPHQGFDKVGETDRVPPTRVGPDGMRFANLDGKTEPLGARIIAVPRNPDSARMRDPTVGFIDYVPAGSLARGMALATAPQGDVQPCAACHGPGLRGQGDVPPIAGRHAIYIYRQLHDMRDGDRKGDAVAPMLTSVQGLPDEDLIALSAYAASLAP